MVRDVARALDISLAEADRIAKLVPEDLGMTIKKALKQEPELAALYKSEESITRLLDTSFSVVAGRLSEVGFARFFFYICKSPTHAVAGRSWDKVVADELVRHK